MKKEEKIEISHQMYNNQISETMLRKSSDSAINFSGGSSGGYKTRQRRSLENYRMKYPIHQSLSDKFKVCRRHQHTRYPTQQNKRPSWPKKTEVKEK